MFKQIVLSGLIGINSFLYANNLDVIVSILPQKTFVEKIGGNRVNVTAMVKPGSNPHSYEPKASQMKALSIAKVYFPIKLEFENVWLEKFAQQNQKMQFSDMTKGIKHIKMLSHTHSHKDKKSAIPYEWTGLYELQKGRYSLHFEKKDGKYADLSMKFLMLKVKDNTDAVLEKHEIQAKKIFEKDKVLLLKDGDKLNSENGFYKLAFKEMQNQTLLTLDVKESGKYLLFTEHFPSEFQNSECFFKDIKKNDITPILSKSEITEEIDPHTWTSPSNVKIMAKNIYTTLVEIDSKNQVYYQKNYEEFLDEITQTDEKIKKILSSLPKKSKIMVFHPSWGYFAKEYGLIQVAIEVEGKEPKPRMLEKIIKKAREEGVKVIFAQKEFSDKSAKAIARELNIKVLKETPLAEDWSANLIKMADAIANNK